MRCFPSYADRWHFDNKIAQAYLSNEMRFPFVPTMVFWNYGDAVAFIEQAEYPQILKLSFGAGAGNVAKIESRKDALQLLNRSFFSTIRSGEPIAPSLRQHAEFRFGRFKNGIKKMIRYRGFHPEYWRESSQYALFQRFIPNNSYDTRVTIIGNRAFAFRRMNRPGDFRASGSGMIDYSPTGIDVRQISIGFEVSDALGTNSLALDFLHDEDGNPLIGEFGYRYVTDALRPCSGVWNRDLSWIENDKSPELLQLETLLDRPLEMPTADETAL
jgi:hypothetical protein